MRRPGPMCGAVTALAGSSHGPVRDRAAGPAPDDHRQRAMSPARRPGAIAADAVDVAEPLEHCATRYRPARRRAGDAVSHSMLTVGPRRTRAGQQRQQGAGRDAPARRADIIIRPPMAAPRRQHAQPEPGPASAAVASRSRVEVRADDGISAPHAQDRSEAGRTRAALIGRARRKRVTGREAGNEAAPRARRRRSASLEPLLQLLQLLAQLLRQPVAEPREVLLDRGQLLAASPSGSTRSSSARSSARTSRPWCRCPSGRGTSPTGVSTRRRRCPRSGGRPTPARGCSRRSPGHRNLPSSSLRNQLTWKIFGSFAGSALLADLQPVPEVVAHVVAAEGQHRERVEAQLADVARGGGGRLRRHDRAR